MEKGYFFKSIKQTNKPDEKCELRFLKKEKGNTEKTGPGKAIHGLPYNIFQ